MSKIVKSSISALSAILMWIMYQLWLPPLSVAYFEGFFFIAICMTVGALNITMWFSNLREERFVWAPPVTIIVLAIVATLLVSFAGSSIFHHGKMYQQIGEVEVVEYDEMIKQIDISQIPIVDEALAKKQADKKIGEDVALGSRADLGTPSIQEVNGEVIFVAPLEHSGFFKWNTYRTTPGYITVSASNPNKVNYVTEIDGEKIEILYQTSAFFAEIKSKFF